MANKYLIIGGGICGTSAAETIRKNDPAGEITIVCDEPGRLYSRIAISKGPLFLGKLPIDSVWLKKEEWYAQNNIRLLAGRRAVKLDAAAKTVVLDDDVSLSYDKLLLALGIQARRWTVPGADKKGVFYVRTLEDFRGYIAAVKTAKQALVLGGGAIGFEMCEMFRLSGLETALSIRETHYWDPVLDKDSGQLIEQALAKAGVVIYRGRYVKEAYGGDSIEGVTLDDDAKIPCQLVTIGIGGFCPHDWVGAAGVKVNRGIVANEYLETSASDVWAAGDAAEYNDVIFGEATQLGSWSNAQNQGRTAGANMTGQRQPYRLVTFYAVSGLGLNIAFVGNVSPLPDRQLIGRGSLAVGSRGRLLLKNGRLVGATLINRTPEMGTIAKLIESQKDLSGRLAELGDLNFDLKQLL